MTVGDAEEPAYCVVDIQILSLLQLLFHGIFLNSDYIWVGHRFQSSGKQQRSGFYIEHKRLWNKNITISRELIDLHTYLVEKQCPTAKFGLMMTLKIARLAINIGAPWRGRAVWVLLGACQRLQGLHCCRNWRAHTVFGQSNECYLDLKCLDDNSWNTVLEGIPFNGGLFHESLVFCIG